MRNSSIGIKIIARMVAALVLAATTTVYAQAEFDNLVLGNPGKCDQIVNREGYALGFSRERKQALWVTYRITKDEAEAQTVSRSGFAFYEDGEVPGSALLADYKGSGYDRGHLAPAGDMRFSARAMRESFSLANMSPQRHAFNAGIWSKLEKAVRETAKREESIFVVTGPVFVDDEEPQFIGQSQVRVPEFYYKVIYDETPPQKMIGFILANQGAKQPLSLFALTVDEVEAATGLDFFDALDEDVQDNLESQIDIALWNI